MSLPTSCNRLKLTGDATADVERVCVAPTQWLFVIFDTLILVSGHGGLNMRRYRSWFVAAVYRWLSLSSSLSPRFNGHYFPGGRGLAGTRMSPFWILLELRMMEVVMTTGAVRRAQLHSNRHHQQTNIQSLPCQVHFLTPNQQCRSSELGKGPSLTGWLIWLSLSGGRDGGKVDDVRGIPRRSGAGSASPPAAGMPARWRHSDLLSKLIPVVARRCSCA